VGLNRFHPRVSNHNIHLTNPALRNEGGSKGARNELKKGGFSYPYLKGFMINPWN